MRTAFLIASGIFVAALANATVCVPAVAKSMKECATEWDQMKAAGQTKGKSYRDFSKQCMSEGAGSAETPPPAPPPPAAEKKPMPKPAATTAPAAKPVSGGREAEHARMHACGAEWKAAKANGTRPAGMHWPQFWHECDQRKKAQGM